MRRLALFLLVWLAGAWLLAAAVGAQGPAQRSYDPATVETVKGTVEEVQLTAFGRRQMNGGVHLRVNTGKETLAVHLGPRFYLEENGIEVKVGQTVEVTGSRITRNGQPVLIAREICLGDYGLELRAEDGTPYWAGAGAPAPGRMLGQRGRPDCACPGCGCRCAHHDCCGRQGGGCR